jgi:alanine racemase
VVKSIVLEPGLVKKDDPVIYLEDVLVSTGGQLCGPAFAGCFSDFCYDSRLVEPGQLFIAVVTEKGDGHDYILDACRGGVSGVICQVPVDLEELGVTCIVVGDTQEAITDWARHILLKRHIEVIGITGSTGKTTTKEAVAAVLGTLLPVFKNHANYSGRYGLPIALGRLEDGQTTAVLELACDHFDEIRHLSDLTRPRVGVVTSVNHEHLEFLGSLENIAQEKGYLIEALPPDGHAILNWDDPMVRAMSTRSHAPIISYGTSRGAKVRAESIATDLGGTEFTLCYGDQESRVRSHLIGRHSVQPVLAAIAAGIAYGVPLDKALVAVSELRPLPGRLNPLEGVGGSIILDDTYSASPASTLAGLDALEGITAARRIAVLGDMTGLGDYEAEAHRLIGDRAAQVVDLLVTKGETAWLIAEQAERSGLAPGEIRVTYTATDAIRVLSSELRAGDVVLVKGSAEARMEDISAALLVAPESDRSGLVRQNAAWQQLRVLRPGRPTWVEVDLEAIAHNVQWIAEMVGPGVVVMAVLKADAYGHGAVKTARTALNNGATALGVACLGEGVLLREAGITEPILNLGYTPAWQARQTVLKDIAATVFTAEVAQALSRAAVDLNAEARIHVKVDTGMGRLGVLPSDALAFVISILDLPGLNLEGIFTHFALADIEDKAYTLWQLGRFREVLSQLETEGIHVPDVHAANSAAILELPESHFNMVRLGIAMYGLNPSSEVQCPPGFRSALAFKTQIAQVKDLPAGSYISYGCTYRTERPSRIAVIPVGYADGFRRAPANWGEVLVRGRRAPIVGRVCMDQTMIDVTDIAGVRQGDEVVLIGRQGNEAISVEEVASRLGTINYEVVSEILARVPRVS